jgi:hypothetical protein
MFWKRMITALKLLIISLFFVIMAAPEWPAFQDERFKIDSILGQQYFDYVVWEAKALLAKGEASLNGSQAYLTADSRKEVVLKYLEIMGQVRKLNAQVNIIYTDPDIDNPGEVAHEFQQQIVEKRAQLTDLQPIAESIIQEQIAAVLIEEDFDLFDWAWPPVQMRVTPLPYILVVSPREEIRQIYSLSLEHGLTIPERENIESALYDSVDLSALVLPIGGVGIYPSMVVETGNINHLMDTVAHEWAHHWLSLHPLGIRYAANPDMRTINETVAGILGDEIGAKVIEQYYPEFIPPPPQPSTPPPESDPDEPVRFDFNGEMRETRVRVDELLADGQVAEAESYMESRRQYFWDNGYRIRKLNQAYFAFYGAYADTPGRRGSDPIGPAVLAVRDDSTSLRNFMDKIGSITSLGELELLASGDDDI